jgi:hypothetical protein
LSLKDLHRSEQADSITGVFAVSSRNIRLCKTLSSRERSFVNDAIGPEVEDADFEPVFPINPH